MQLRTQQHSGINDAYNSLNRRLHPDLTTSHIAGQNSISNITNQSSFPSSHNGRASPDHHRSTNYTTKRHSQSVHNRPHTQMEFSTTTAFSNLHDSDSDSLLFNTNTRGKTAQTVQGLSRIRPHSQQDFTTHTHANLNHQRSASSMQDLARENPRKSASSFARETQTRLLGFSSQKNTDSRSSVDVGVGLNLEAHRSGPENSVPERERDSQMATGKNCPALLSDCQQHIFTSECGIFCSIFRSEWALNEAGGWFWFLCMYACMCVCTRVERGRSTDECIHICRKEPFPVVICAYVHTYMYTLTHTDAHIHAYIHTYMQACGV
jgi:hypothetical protein